MAVEIYDCVQGEADWYECRKGVPTASMFATVMAKGKEGGASVTRKKYLHRLAGEIITGEPSPEGYKNSHMDRGNAMEDEARQTYAFLTDAEIERVGFIRNGQKGASPDSLIGEDGGLEIKTAIPEVQIDRLIRDRLPPEHVAQVQGNLWVSEREYWDFVSYWPRLPILTVRVYRDEAYIKTIASAVDAFNEELALLVERIRNYGSISALKDQLSKSVEAA